jgi:hypothetical protein
MRLPAKLLMLASLVFAMLFVVIARAAIAQSGQATPTSVKATYKVYKAGIWIGTIEEHFTREGDNYKIVSDTETAGPLRLFLRDQLTVTSQGTVDASGLKPSAYQFARRNDQTKSVSSTFDWIKHQLVSRRNGESETFELPTGTQDRVSAMYQFIFSITRTVEVSVWMSQGKKPEIYHYRKQGEPVLTVNKESIATVYYAREAAAGESRAHLWLAKDKYYLPVKIMFEDASGGSLEQMLVSLHTE